MMFRFHPEAEIELNEAVDYYESCQKHLGLEFAQEIYTSIHRIIDFPNAWQSMTPTSRRCLINRFPFGVIYTIKENELIILAVMHLHQKPGYWKKRSV